MHSLVDVRIAVENVIKYNIKFLKCFDTKVFFGWVRSINLFSYFRPFGELVG